MLQKTIDGIKRLLIGYGFLLSLVLIGLSFGLPFVLTASIGLGLIYPAKVPVSHEIFLAISILSVSVTVIVGLRWLFFPSQWLDHRLEQLHARLLQSNNRLLLRFVGIVLAFPLFAFILSPWAIVWIGFEEVAHSARLVLGDSFRIIAFSTGFIWLAVVVGRLRPRSGAMKRVVFRSRTVFIDWVLEPYKPEAARREREKLSSG
ncbi:MAG: hypothetical protein GXP38_10560 [Chloroflexi bacterium]|nr:hypothetical protein [Chloroflexota bacterium]